MRQAAAAARQELLKLAAIRLNVPVDTLTVKDGVVSVAGNAAKKVSYGQLIGGKQFNVRITATGSGWDMKVAPETKAKDPKDYKIVGTSAPRVELPPKLTGEFTYAHDVRVPGMLHGRVVRPPTITSKPTSIDESSVKNIPGIVKVVQEESFVGVVATTEWAAIKAAKALKVTWAEPLTKMPASAEAVYAYLKNTKSFRDQVPVNKGNPDAALSPGNQNFRSNLSLAFSIARDARTFVCRRRCRQGSDYDLDGDTRIFRNTEGCRRTTGSSRERCSSPLSRGVRQLWSLEFRRRIRGRCAALSRSRQAGTRAVDARGRAWLGAQRAGAVGYRESGSRFARQNYRVGFCRS